MIVTDIGAKQLADNDKVTIDKVVFSDFDFNLVTNDQMQAMTGFNDNENVVVKPDVALLANNHVIVQADAPDVDFHINSVFLFGTGQPTGDMFLLAVDENQSGTFSQELDINAIRKLSFNATSSDIVLQSDLKSMVDVAYKSAQASYALDSENDAIYLMAQSFTNSIASSKADVASLSSYATVSSVDTLSSTVSAEINSYTSQLASKADTAMLSSYMTTDNIDSVADSISSNVTSKANEIELSDYTKVSDFSSLSNTTSYINSELSNKADLASLSNYMTNDNVDSLANSIAVNVTSKANEIELSGYTKTSDFNSLSAVVSETNSGLSTKANTNDVNTLSSAINDNLNSKANISDLASYAKSADLSSAVSQADSSFESIGNQFASVSSLVTITSSQASQATLEATNLTKSNSYRIFLREQFDSSLEDTLQSVQANIINNANVLNSLSGEAIQYHGNWNGNILDLISQSDGIYWIQANWSGPKWFDGWGIARKYHNGTDTFIELVDNGGISGVWTKFGGWREHVNDTELSSVSSELSSVSTTLSSVSNNVYNPSDYNSLVSHVGFLQSKADTDAGNIINNNRLINSNSALINSVQNNVVNVSNIENANFDNLSKRFSDATTGPNMYRGMWNTDVLLLKDKPAGNYWVMGGGTNLPTNTTSGWGSINVIKLNPYDAMLVGSFGNDTFVNYWISSVWTGWKRLATNVDIDALTPTTSTVGKADPSSIFRGTITSGNLSLKDLTRPDGIYKVSTWISQPVCEDLPDGFYKDLGYTFTKTTIDDHTGHIHVVGTRNQFTLSWIGWGTSWEGWLVSSVT